MKIDSFTFGNILISGKKYDHDVIVSWDGEIRERESSHTFTKGELMDILMKDPEVVLVGTGTAGLMKIEPETEKAAKREKIELISNKSDKIVREFNKLAKSKKVTALIHLTC
jgi:hypothetical protein